MKLDRYGRFISRGLRGDRSFRLILVLLVLSIAWWALDTAGKNPGTQTGHIHAKDLTEISGIVLSRQNKNVIWAHNDSGDQARIFALRTDGKPLGVFRLEGTTAIDWEDIAIGPGPLAEKDYLYIADTGNNALSRRTVTIYRVPEPAVDTTATSRKQTLTGVEVLPMRFPAEPRECETLLVDPLNGDIYLVTRDRTGRTKEIASVFHAPGPHRGGSLQTLKALTSFVPPGSIRGGDISRDGRLVILRSHSLRPERGALLWKRSDPGSPLHEIFSDKPTNLTVRYEPQGESIAFSPGGDFFFTVSEGSQAPIYRFEVP